MEMKDYVQTVVNKFESKNFDDESQIRAADKMSELHSITNELVEICKRLDDVKRHIFYKKGEPIGKTVSGSETRLSVKEFRVLHAAVGLATEGVEFLESAVEGIANSSLDDVHLVEELGDCQWYSAVASDALGSSFEQVADANVSKLNIRYALKYSNDKALTRDLAAERAALEAATKRADPPARNNAPEYLLKDDSTNLITFPGSEEMYWEEDIKAKYLKFGATIIVFVLGFLAALLGPLFLSTIF